MVVSKRWFKFHGGTKFNSLATSTLPHFNLNFNLFLTSVASGISSHGLETTVYGPLATCMKIYREIVAATSCQYLISTLFLHSMNRAKS